MKTDSPRRHGCTEALLTPNAPAKFSIFDFRFSIFNVFVHLALVLLAFLYLAPFLWLICASFKRGEDVFRYTFLPWRHLGNLTLDNYRVLFSRQPFGRWLANSLFIASLQTVLVVATSSLGGFAL